MTAQPATATGRLLQRRAPRRLRAPAVAAGAGMVVLMATLLAPSSHAAVRMLVAIGNDVGLASEEPLRWAEADAARVAEAMVEVGGVSATRARVLQGASAAELERTLLMVKGEAAEIRRRGERSELVVSYSGHGDRTHVHLGDTALPVVTLLAWLDAVGADATVVLLDACRTSSLRAGQSRGAVRGPAFDVTVVDDFAPQGRVVIASASDGEVAQESDDLEGAFFTHHWLAGLRGAADDNSDGVVSLGELYAYARGQTLATSFQRAAVQHPELSTSLRGQGDFVMARLERAQATLVLDAALAGSFLFVDAPAGRVIVEVRKPRGANVTLAVPAGRLRVLQRDGAAAAVADVDVPLRARAVLTASDFIAAPRLAGRARGADFDPTPWLFAAGLLVTSAPALPQGTSGAFARAERRLGQLPLAAAAEVAISQAQGGDALRVVQEGDVRAVVGAAAETWTPLGRLSAGAGVGGQLVAQRVVRVDAARLEAAGLGAQARQQGTAAGPMGALRAGLLVPVYGPWGVELNVHGALSALPLDGVWAPRVYAAVSCGAAVEF